MANKESPQIVFKQIDITVLPPTPELKPLDEVNFHSDEKRDSDSKKVMCCSSTLTKRSADYIVKITFLSISMLVSLVGLAYIEIYGDKCSSMTPVLSGILTGSLAVLVPAPKRGD